MDAAVARATSSLSTRKVQPSSPSRATVPTCDASISPPSSPLSTIVTHPQPPQSPTPPSPLHHEFQHNLPPPPSTHSPGKGYKMSQARMKKLLDAWEHQSSSSSDQEQDEQQHNNDTDKQEEQDISNTNNNAGIMARASKWLSNRRQKYKQQTLKQQAEEQRQRILQQLSPQKQKEEAASSFKNDGSFMDLYCSHPNQQSNYNTDSDDGSSLVIADHYDDIGLQLQEKYTRSHSDIVHTLSPNNTVPKRGMSKAKSDTKVGELRSTPSGYGVTVDLSDVDLTMSAPPLMNNAHTYGTDCDDDNGEQSDLSCEEQQQHDKQHQQQTHNTTINDEHNETQQYEDNNDDDDDDDVFLTKVSIQPEPPSKYNNEQIPFILTQKQMLQIAKNALPPSISYSKWKRIYSLQRDGDSFDAFLRLVHKEQRTLLVVRTTKGDVFGGYADTAWEVMHRMENSGGFYGSAQACLFRVVVDSGDDDDHHQHSLTKRHDTKPKEEVDSSIVLIYKWTGANRYIQLCDSTHKMLAFGGGGTEGTFGLTVSDDFRRGSTGYCDTFGNDVLCSSGEDFEVLDLECWGFVTSVF